MPQLESNIQARVEADLKNLEWAEVRVEGRTVTISGDAPPGGMAFAKRRIRGVFGVGEILVEHRGAE